MKFIKAAILTILALSVSLGGLSAAVVNIVRAEGILEEVASTTMQGVASRVSDIVKEEVASTTKRAARGIWEKFKDILRKFSDFITAKIGINIYEGLKLFGNFLIWFFESLAKFARWIVGLL